MTRVVYKNTEFKQRIERTVNKLFSHADQHDNNSKILVILHLYYFEAWKEIKGYLHNLDELDYSLYITYTKEDGLDQIRASICAEFPNAVMEKVPNCGFDLGPFVHVLSKIDLTQYDCVIKVHSKGTKRPFQYIYNQVFFRRSWFLNLYNAILSPHAINIIRNTMETVADPTIIAASNLIICDPPEKQSLYIRFGDRLGYKLAPGYRYVAGTCFAMDRMQAQAVQGLKLRIEDFEDTVEDCNVDLAHFMERYLCSNLNGDVNFLGIRSSYIRRVLTRPLALLCGLVYPVAKKIRTVIQRRH